MIKKTCTRIRRDEEGKDKKRTEDYHTVIVQIITISRINAIFLQIRALDFLSSILFFLLYKKISVQKYMGEL